MNRSDGWIAKTHTHSWFSFDNTMRLTFVFLHKKSWLVIRWIAEKFGIHSRLPKDEFITLVILLLFISLLHQVQI